MGSHTTDSSEESRLPESALSSPPETGLEMDFVTAEEREMLEEEKRAEAANTVAEERRKKHILKKKKEQFETKQERDAKAAQLDELLRKSAAFSNILTKKTEVLGRVGSGFDGKALGDHDLVMAKQPKSMINGTMRPYQLEGLTWMMEICQQGMSGILADEMGLGKTIQTISLIALLREQENYLGPHLIVAPLSTLSNWIEEFQKWTPNVPVLLYHGPPAKRQELRRKQILNHIKNGRPDEKFPVVCTSYDMVIRDEKELSKINWEMIIIDEGHRMKNSDAKLFRILKTFTSATRLLITGTPLQNNLKELWSLLNFLLPTIFTNWEQFESWFDFSDLQDEETTEEFLSDQIKQDLIKKIHLVLQPLLLRRVKADVEHMLPKKREYLLYAPMTEEQTELYNILSDKAADVRQYLEDKVVERLTGATNTPLASRKASPCTSSAKKATTKVEESDSEKDLPLSIRTRKIDNPKPSTPKNAFQAMMGRKASSSLSTSRKRKSMEELSSNASKSLKSSRESTPGSAPARVRGRPPKSLMEVPSSLASSAKSTSNSTPFSTKTRGRPPNSKGRKTYVEAEASEEDELSDDEFEKKLANELAQPDDGEPEDDLSQEERERARTLELAKKEISAKKLGNPLMQLRLACNSPHNFYNPWSQDSGLEVDETLVTSSGKMLLLDRLLPSLYERGHKVLIFSQFKTQLDILEDYARDLRGWNVCRIDGSVAQEDRQNQIRDFNTNPDYKLFLLSTRAGGQGINLASADTVILFDSDWNPQQDLQAQDRAHRIGQKRPVVIFRLATKGTVEEELLSSAGAKRRLEKLVIKKGGYKTMGQKMDKFDSMSKEALAAVLLKDGEVFKYTGGDVILSDEDLDTLCDRSDAAYARAEKGLGDATRFKIVETKMSGLMGTSTSK